MGTSVIRYDSGYSEHDGHSLRVGYDVDAEDLDRATGIELHAEPPVYLWIDNANLSVVAGEDEPAVFSLLGMH